MTYYEQGITPSFKLNHTSKQNANPLNTIEDIKENHCPTVYRSQWVMISTVRLIHYPKYDTDIKQNHWTMYVTVTYQ